MYAEDTQVYMTFKPRVASDILSRPTDCVGHIRHWMAQNYLKLNDNKTEFMMIQSKFSMKGSMNLLSVPRVRTMAYGERRFSNAAPYFWNNLPEKTEQVPP